VVCREANNDDPPMTDTPPDIDYTRLSFPSDRLTVGAARAAFPHRFRTDRANFTDVESLMAAERWLARRAFDLALGRPDPLRDDPVRGDRQELIGALADSYKRFGLSPGLKHTRELVKAFEAAAAGQAKEHLGRDR
jgi:hypothetical protein